MTLPSEFVLYDQATEDVVRNKDGLCVLAPLGEREREREDMTQFIDAIFPAGELYRRMNL